MVPPPQIRLMDFSTPASLNVLGFSFCLQFKIKIFLIIFFVHSQAVETRVEESLAVPLKRVDSALICGKIH